ncbi:hypothetical protein J7E38_14160 [Bacillus sp. ISL-35]|uniref:hypothetical protein n=1 Tax=Bacillus sp. ISL-35 TaxID=2819122 RepID=UPI001BEB5B37|nr:hypothetical protein [Bacillus sp. ISL-35]MBT2680155.1 hypothetical protein [Bacillus sp. ISL-35]MBT2704429.1 hypothetical protein [Chryseobacterium sp. ISL-80]
MKLFANLFKTKNQKVKEACQDIHVIIEGSQSHIADMQENIQSLQDGVKAMQINVEEYLRLCEENIKIYDEMLSYLHEKDGVSE